MRRRLASLALGLRRSPVGAIGALSGLTVRESVRKKIFVVLVVFTIVMLGATALLPSIRAEDRVPLIETWALRAISFFGVLIAVFLAGVSIPEDIEERRIFSLLTKPLARWQLIAGRFAGFATLLLAFGAAAFAICAGFVRIVAHNSPGLLANRTEYAAKEFRITEEDGKSKIETTHTDADPQVGTIRGEGQTTAVWYFRSLDVDDLPPVVTVKFLVEIQAPSMMTFGQVEVFLKPTSLDVPPADAAALGWKVDFVSPPVDGQPLPLRLASRRALAKMLIPFQIDVPRSWFGPTGNLDIGVKRADPNLVLAVRPRSVVVMSRMHNFEWNFAKALASTFMLWLVVLAVTTASSTALSGPVNLIFGVAVFVAGSMIGFVRESLPTVHERIQIAEKAEAEAEADHDDVGGEDIPVPVLRVAQAISTASLELIPDLNTFDATASVLRGQDIPSSRLFDSLKFTFAYVAGALLVGLALLRMREFR